MAEDITSETFVRVWTARDRVDLTTVIGYLLTIARRLYLQGVKLNRRGESLVADPPDARPSHAAEAQGRAELDAVIADLQTLAEPDRAALLMRAEDSMSYDDIGRALGITPGAAKVKVCRARQKLMTRRMARDGGPR